MKILIISHPKPYHLDDFLAVSLLMYKYRSEFVIHRTARNQQEIYQLIEQIRPGLTIVVDVGQRYGISMDIRFYDHHHDANLPCSLVLVLKNEFPELWEKIGKIEKLKKLIEYIDYRDRFGVKAVSEKLGITDPIGIQQYLIPLLFSEPSAVIGENFVKFVESFSRVYETTRTYEINNLRIAVSYADPREEPASVIFDATDADILIQRNTRNPQQTLSLIHI